MGNLNSVGIKVPVNVNGTKPDWTSELCFPLLLNEVNTFQPCNFAPEPGVVCARAWLEDGQIHSQAALGIIEALAEFLPLPYKTQGTTNYRDIERLFERTCIEYDGFDDDSRFSYCVFEEHSVSEDVFSENNPFQARVKHTNAGVYISVTECNIGGQLVHADDTLFFYDGINGFVSVAFLGTLGTLGFSGLID